MVERQIIETAGRFLEEVKKHNITVIKAYLFGSQARGLAHEWSDIDIALICLPFAADQIDQNMMLWKLALQIDPRIAPVSLSPDDFEKEYMPLVPEIKKGLPLTLHAA